MDKFSLICDLIIAIAGIVPTIIALIYLVKNIIQNKNWTLVMQMALKAMSTVEAYAETHPDMTSEDKLNMALDSIKEACAVAGVDVDEELIKRIIEYIAEMCAWAKTVNVELVLEQPIVEKVVEKQTKKPLNKAKAAPAKTVAKPAAKAPAKKPAKTK